MNQCFECGHAQAGYPEGYCEHLAGAWPNNLRVCGCTNPIHSDVERWRGEPPRNPYELAALHHTKEKRQ